MAHFSGHQAATLRRGAVIAATTAVAAQALLLVAPVPAAVRGAVGCVILLVAALAAMSANVVASRRITGRDTRTFGLLAASLFAWAVGSAAQLVYVLTQGGWPQGPSFEDFAFLLGLLLLLPAAAEFGDPVSAGRGRRAAAAIDLLALLTAGGAFAYMGMMKPLGFMGPGADVTRAVILSVYAVLSTVLFLYPLVFRHDPWTAPAAFSVAGFGLGAVMAQATVLTLGLGVYNAGSAAATAINIPFVASFCSLGIAGVWRMTMVPSATSNPAPVDQLPGWPMIVVSITTIIGVPTAIMIAVTAPDEVTRMVMAVAAALLAVLIIARNLLLVIEHRAVQERGATETHYRAIVDSTPSAILVVDGEGIVLYANGVAALLLGAATPYDLMGIDMGDLLPSRGAVLKEEAEIGSLIEALVTNARRPMRATPLRLTRLRTLTGEIIDVQRTAAAIMYDGIPAVIFQGENVTARLNAERDSAEYQEKLRALATELVATEERERRMLAEALHDRVGQALAVSRMRLRSAQSEGAATGDDVDVALTMIEDAISETRTLTTELAPPILYEIGLLAALQQMCDEFSSLHGLACTVSGASEVTLAEASRAILYRSTRELLMNSLKHARANRATVTVEQDSEGVTVTVADDGVGFNVSRVPSGSFGLLSVDESVRALGGTLVIESKPGKGTRVRVSVRGF